MVEYHNHCGNKTVKSRCSSLTPEDSHSKGSRVPLPVKSSTGDSDVICRHNLTVLLYCSIILYV